MLALVIDTNLFHEFRPLETLPWDELTEAEEIILLVSDPVQTELDEQKKSPKGRVKRRALEWIQRFRKMLKNNETDLMLRAEAPRVILRLDDTLPSKEHGEVLDLTVPDDVIVAIAASHSVKRHFRTLLIFSDDLRPMRKARQVGLDFMEIPDGWRREAESTDDEKEKQQLRDEIAFLKRKEPDLVLSCASNSPVVLTIPVYEPLNNDQIEYLTDVWCERHPIETNFERARADRSTSRVAAIEFGLNRHEFRPVSATEIEDYKEKQYPSWLSACREQLSLAHEIFNYVAQRFALDIELVNQGTRPADDLQISFTAKGAVAIMPARFKPEDGNRDEEALLESFFDLPNPPKAPQGKWETIDPFAAYLGRSVGDLNLLHKAYIGPTLHDTIRDSRRDPNEFYYKDRPSEPVGSYSLTCEQFRHAGEPENFRVWVRPVGEDVIALDGQNALIEAACNASNLSIFHPLRIALKLNVEVRSTFQLLQEKLSQ